MVRVGDIAQQIRGVTFAKQDSITAPAPGYVPVLRAGNIQESGLEFNDLVYVPSSRVSEKQRVRRNDVVIAASSGSLDVVGKAARSHRDFEGGFGAFCKVLRPSGDVDPAYFAHYFKTSAYRQKISSLAEGANINNLKNEHLNDLLLPLPPFEEQRRIGAILDQVHGLRDKRRQALAYSDRLTQSIFLDMFGQPESQWPAVTLGEIAAVKGGKRLPKGANYAAGVTAHPYIRVVDLKAGTISTADLRYLGSDVQATISRYTVGPDDVVISIAGSIGLIAAVPEELVGANLTENAAKLVPTQEDMYESEWLAAALRSANLQAQIRSHVGQVTIGKLALFRIEKIDLTLPPIEVQRRFLKRVRKASELRGVLDSGLRDLKDLSEVLQARAFRGEL
jgi:type I restriction enzyme S subunit